jgi:hypothetical protein
MPEPELPKQEDLAEELSYMRTMVRQGLDLETAWSTALRSIGLVELDEP